MRNNLCSWLVALMMIVPSVLSAQNIDLKLKNVTVQDAITILHQNESYSIIVSADDVNLKQKISINAENAQIQQVLEQIFAGQDVTWTINGKSISVTKNAPVTVAKRTVKGQVVDQKGEPLAGATILNGKVGHLTDLDGNFSFEITSFPARLDVSFIGFADQSITLAGTEPMPLSIILDEERNVLDDVVVVGYASMKKRDLVGAVDMVDSKVIGDRSNGNLARSLQGEIPGLNIQFNDSKPSRSASFNVRGETSIGSGGSALVLVDGVEGDLNSINPQDVASVSVLKDASSTAVYGARGAFGVILVTTKNPDKGRPVINYSGSVSVNRRTVVPDIITDGLTFVNWWKDAYNGYYNGTKALPDHIDSTVPYTDAIYEELLRRRNNPNLSDVTALEGHSSFGWAYYGSTNWYDLFYKDVNLSTEHNLSVSGGNEHADYYVSGRFYNMDGIYRVGNEDFKKYDLRAKGTLKVRPWFKITNNISMSVSNQYEPKHPRNNFAVQRALNHVGMPLSPVKNPDGTWTEAAAVTGYASFCEGTSYRTNDYVYLREKISADIDIVKDVLKLQADYSFNYTTRTRIDVQTPVEYSNRPGQIQLESASAGESLTQNEYKTRYQASNIYLTYNPDLGENHNLNVLVGYNVEDKRYQTLTVSQMDMITTSKPSFSLMQGVADAPSAGGWTWAYMGAFFRVNYGFKSKYLVEVSGRYDGSSKFPTYSRWGFFPSASAAWVLSEEPWMKWSRNVLDIAKIRISAGSMGNGNVDPYSYTSEMAVKTATDVILGGAYPVYTSVGTTVPVSLTWETATTYDIGLDLGFFNNRLSVTGDMYRRYTTDMYTPASSLPAVFGTSAPKGNNAEMMTNGWELSLSWRDEFNLGGKPFSYSVKGMVWDNVSKITKYENATGSLGTVANYIKNGGTPSNYYVGMTVGEIWGYTIAGLFKDQADIDNSATHNFQQASDKITRPGQVKVVDLDKSGVIDPGEFKVNDHGDLSIIGNQQARYRFGINLAANWNGIGLSVFLQGVGKRDWYPGSDAGYFWGKYGRPFFSFIPAIHNYTDDMYDPEKNNWDTAYWPRITSYQSNATNNWTKVLEVPNTRYIQNAAYVRVKNIQVDYSFNRNVCDKLHLQGLKLYLTAENPFCYTPLHKYAPNFDPEGLSYDTDFASAAQGYTYPILKTFTFGINVTF